MSKMSYEKMHDKLLKEVKMIKQDHLRENILMEYEECGDIVEATDRIKMFHDFMGKVKGEHQ